MKTKYKINTSFCCYLEKSGRIVTRNLSDMTVLLQENVF